MVKEELGSLKFDLKNKAFGYRPFVIGTVLFFLLSNLKKVSSKHVMKLVSYFV